MGIEGGRGSKRTARVTASPRGTWVVGRARRTSDDELRIDVDGEDLVVRAPGHRLTDAAEAWGTMFALPAARAGVSLTLPAPVDPTWLAGAQANVATAAGWWGGDDHLEVRTPSLGPWARRRAGRAPAHEPSAAKRQATTNGPAPASGRALCFTGGVDSFYSLLAGDHRPTHLLFVHGFDIPLADAGRRGAASAGIRAVAAARDLGVLEVETNLRTHHAFAPVDWGHTHGAALAGVGLLLTAEIGTLIVPPSYAHDRLIPWGSRPDLDPRWSVPGRLRVEHGDVDLYRRERLALIVGDPLVQQHLRVCWAHLDDGLNCGRCEKCVRTMIHLASLGALDTVRTFPHDRPLAEVIDQMDPPGPATQVMWRDLTEMSLEPDVLAAIERVIASVAP